MSEAIAAGAVICGAYFGDKMTPLSETTILVPQLVGGGLTVGQHARNMFWTAAPELGISLVVFLLLGLNAEPDGALSTDAAREALGQAFNISAVNLLPLLALGTVLGDKCLETRLVVRSEPGLLQRDATGPPDRKAQGSGPDVLDQCDGSSDPDGYRVGERPG
jgi:Na+/H+ antiporter family